MEYYCSPDRIQFPDREQLAGQQTRQDVHGLNKHTTW
jgi:hypothetical protein